MPKVNDVISFVNGQGTKFRGVVYLINGNRIGVMVRGQVHMTEPAWVSMNHGNIDDMP